MKARIEVGDIFRRYGEAYRRANRLSMAQHKAMNAIEACRTAALGGHLDRCDSCEYQRNSYNSCRNRHCPKCQSLARERWLEARKAELLPVKYFHLVFTLPHELHPIIRTNEALAYSLLFKAASQTMLQLAADPKHLGLKAGMMAILHTWGQNLIYHPHLHCIVPGGGIGLSGKGWKSCRKKFFLPVRVLSALFRGKFLALIQQVFERGELQFPGNAASLQAPVAFGKLLSSLYRKEWVVYAKEPFGGPEQVLGYLGRYTHRVAISNNRIQSLHDAKVSFEWRDYKDANKHKLLTLNADEFIRRFLLHILPKGFCKIRYFGFLANRNKWAHLAQCVKSLKAKAPKKKSNSLSWQDFLFQLTGKDPRICPRCQGKMIRKILLPTRAPPHLHLPL